MRRHVFDHPEDLRPHLVEHVECLAGVQKRQILRGGDDDGARDLRLLGQGHLHVAGTGRQVDDQHVQLAPLHLRQHLLKRAHQHRAAPDDRLILAGHQADGHQRDAVIAKRQDRLVVGR